MAPGKMCFGKKAEDPNNRRNEEIEKIIRVDKKKQEREVKLLLLGTDHGRGNDIVAIVLLTDVIGAGESGKSTVLKQMRIIHAGGFSKLERKQWRVVIFNNLINAFQILFSAMQEQGTDYEDEDNVVRSNT